ncbi:MAG: hypothetical protein RL885_07320 [Planctomycetota bacterium]
MSILAIAGMLLAAMTGEGQPELEARIRIEAPDGPVSFGEPFQLTIIREWSASGLADPWRDDAVAPLRLTALKTLLVEEEGFTRETRHFEAMAFDLGELRLPPIELRVRSRVTGSALIVSSLPVALEVRGALDPAAPGDIEWPRPFAEAPIDWLAWGARSVGAAALILLVVCLVRGRRRNQDGSEVLAPAERARRDLEAARAGDVDPASAVHCILRRYLEERFGLPAMEASSEELITCERLHAALAAPLRERLGQLFQTLDLARFAPTVRSDVEPWVDDAQAWIADIEASRSVTEVDREVA